MTFRWDKLQARLPQLGAQLGLTMASQGIDSLVTMTCMSGVTVMPTVSLGWREADGHRVKISLSIDIDDSECDDIRLQIQDEETSDNG